MDDIKITLGLIFRQSKWVPLLGILMFNGLFSFAQKSAPIQPDSKSIKYLKSVEVFASRPPIQSLVFKTKPNILGKGWYEPLTSENLALFISLKPKDFLFIKSVDIPIRRKGSNNVDTPSFFIRLGDRRTDTLIPLVPKYSQFSENKMRIEFNQVLDVRDSVKGFYFIMKHKFAGADRAWGNMFEVVSRYRTKFTFELSPNGHFIPKIFYDYEELIPKSKVTNWGVTLRYGTGKEVKK